MLFKPSVTTSNDVDCADGIENGTRTQRIVTGIAWDRGAKIRSRMYSIAGRADVRS
jgi:hypothetical protein